MLFTFCAIFWGISIVQSANILFLLPVPSPSHRVWNNVLIEALAERAHNLTVLTVEYERSRPNVTYIRMENIYESLSEYHNKTPWSLSPKGPFTIIKQHHQRNNFISRKLFQSAGLEQLANYPRSFIFHAVIFDFTLGQSLLGFVEFFNFPPLISVSPHALPSALARASSTQILPSYISHYSTTSTPASLRANMSQRFMNMIYHAFDSFYRSMVFVKNENRRISKVFGEKNKLNVEQLEYSDVVLLNRDFSFDDVLPLPPNVVPIGGLQVERKNELPNDDVNTFVSGSRKPILIFSMGGGNLLAEDLGWVNMNEIVEAFKELKEYNIICKCDGKSFRNHPENVLFVDWFQQNLLLANPLVKLVISPGGLLTIQEAIWHEKIVLGIPIEIDHHKNIQRAIDMGFAEAINVLNFTKYDIIVKVRVLLDDPTYIENVKKVSKLMKSSPMKPSERAIYWIEQVLKHNGLDHLKPESRKLSFYKLYMLDLALFGCLITGIYMLIMQYHFIKQWILKRELKRRELEDMNKVDKLKNE